MKHVSDLRTIYGESFATELPDGSIVPWKPLSIEDYISYTTLLNQDYHLPAAIENEIFKKCVLDQYFLNNIHKLKAGIVSTVVSNIIGLSFPASSEEIEYSLNNYRYLANTLVGELVVLICQAFPAYSPDDLLKMPFSNFMYRVALAEKKLISTGILNEPLNFDNQNKKLDNKARAKKDMQNLKQIWEEKKQSTVDTSKIQGKYIDSESNFIVSKYDIAETEFVNTGHEKMDMAILEQQMLKDTLPFYQEYIEQIKRGESVKILSNQERAERFKKREEEKQLQYLRSHQQQKEKPLTLEEHKKKKKEGKIKIRKR